jgi:hypothetical protein
MTQVNRAQAAPNILASTPRATGRTLAQRRADLEHQIRSRVAQNMALTDPVHVRQRMKELRKRAGNPSQYKVADDLRVPPRTFQSWENAEVETDRRNYDKVAAYYTKKLKQKVTTNWILFGQDEEPPLPAATPDLLGEFNGDQAPDWAQRLIEQQAELDEKLTNVLEYLAYLTAVARRGEDPGSTEEAA